MIYWQLFWTFFKIGAFTFGGGYAMLPLIEEEVMSHGWMSMQELINFVAVSESTPGPFAVNISTYVGTETAGILGAVVASLGVVLPSFLIILIIARCFFAFKENKVVKGAMHGLRPAVVGLITAAALGVGKTAFFAHGVSYEAMKPVSFGVSVGLFALVMFAQRKKVHPIAIIVLCAAVGIVAGSLGILH